ncbi:hypothetical protein JXB02_06330 [Candidatus Woesearchaeota archaeon]|nr:hypothetical protein [Candidatus Woesearchaeota archaeon]
MRYAVLILAMLIIALVAGCGGQQTSEASAGGSSATASETAPTGIAEADTIGETVTEVDALDTELGGEELEDIDLDLGELDW